MATDKTPAQAQAEAVAKAKADALNDPASANSVLAECYDDHDWRPAVLDTNTTEGIRNTLKAHAAAIQALADQIDGIHKARLQRSKPSMFAPGQGNTQPQPSPVV